MPSVFISRPSRVPSPATPDPASLSQPTPRHLTPDQGCSGRPAPPVSADSGLARELTTAVAAAATVADVAAAAAAATAATAAPRPPPPSPPSSSVTAVAQVTGALSRAATSFSEGRTSGPAGGEARGEEGQCPSITKARVPPPSASAYKRERRAQAPPLPARRLSH